MKYHYYKQVRMMAYQHLPSSISWCIAASARAEAAGNGPKQKSMSQSSKVYMDPYECVHVWYKHEEV